jgi:hypothetical protein
MSEQEAQDKGLRLIPTWLPVLSAILAGIFGAGSTYATIHNHIAEMREKVQRVDQERRTGQESIANAIGRIDIKLDDFRDRLSRIEGKLSK